MCHLILLMPVFALLLFWVLPLAVAAPAYAAVAGLSVWMYALIWRAMQRPVLGGMEELRHSSGEVVEVAGDALRVRMHNELWNATSSDTLHPGDHVRVVDVSGLMLRVVRDDGGARQA